MFQLLMLIASYGSFLLLLMPPTGPGVLTAAFLFLIGLAVLIRGYNRKVYFEEKLQLRLIPASALTVCCLAPFFYNRWLPSSKMQAIAAIFHLSVESLLLIGAVALSALSFYIVWTWMHRMANLRNGFTGNILISILAAVVTVCLAQIMLALSVLSMGIPNFLWAVAIVAVLILLLYCLFGKFVLPACIGSGVFMIVSTVCVYVYSFRGRLFEPVDLFSAGTAMNVLDNYSLFPIPSSILAGWGIFAVMMVVLLSIQPKKDSGLTARRRAALLAACAIAFACIFLKVSNLKTYHWQKEGASFNGYVLDFVSKFKEISASAPDGYSEALIAEFVDQYGSGNNAGKSEPPHIIVIMDEAFSDLRVTGNFETNMEVMPFVSSLKENTISGYALASVYGGNTANSEYEFLTGNSMAWLSPNVVPYQQYIRESTYSMVSYLKSSHDYKTIAMHPYRANGWNRPLAYEYLGFDECHFIEDFPQQDYIREYVSDREMFEYLIETYEDQKESCLFLFGVTMQNHGGYLYSGDNFTKHISLPEHGSAYPEVEQYLSLVYETDKAVEYLITYFQNVEENVVIVFFGDHQPKFDEAFYEAISGTTAATLEEQQKRYQVPFFIWANYDIEEKQIECSSLNYLSSYVYEAAGIAMPPYNQFLKELEAVIPAINANGYYSAENNCYIAFDEAIEHEKVWLKKYEALQYNNLFDTENRNDVLFPVPKDAS